jgi:hypothetical protein
MGGKSSAGYGQFWSGERLVGAHRWMYEYLVGPISDGLQLDHLCRVPACVNPAHLEPVTPKVNYLRGESPLAVNARKSVCKNGHPFDEENTVIVPRGRQCRACRKEASRKYELERIGSKK